MVFSGDIILRDNGPGQGDIALEDTGSQTLSVLDVATVSGSVPTNDSFILSVADVATASGFAFAPSISTSVLFTPDPYASQASRFLVALSGTSASAQEFVTTMDNILVNVYGWELVVKAADSPTIKDYWWRSRGEEPGARMDLYCGLVASGTNVYTRAATYVDPVTSGIRDRMSATSVSAIIPWSNNKKFWVLGNKDFVHFAGALSNVHHAGGFGYLDSYYNYQEDPYPVCVYGQAVSTNTFSDTGRLLAYTASAVAVATQSGVAGGGFLATTASGSFSAYDTGDYDSILQYNAPALRDGRYTAIRKVLYISPATSFVTAEVRGDIPYLWKTWNSTLLIGEPVTASGFLFDSDQFTFSERFICINEFGQSRNTYLIGPTDEFDLTHKGFVNRFSGLKLFFEGDRGIERRGASFIGGLVPRWRNQANFPSLGGLTRNDAVQETEARQPTAVSAGLTGFYDAISLVSGTQQYLVGASSVDVATDGGALFVVASYSSGTHRTPIISIRGDISGQDTMFSLEFNESSTNSATVVNTAGGGTDRIEWTGLSSNTSYIVTNVVSGTNSTLYLNGSSDSSVVLSNTKGEPSIPSVVNYSIGVNQLSGGSTGSSYASAEIAEIIYLAKLTTGSEVDAIHLYLSQKYGIDVEE
jgi:hypothetical protein